jgi:5,10-methylenetetrahydrofolate reductase
VACGALAGHVREIVARRGWPAAVTPLPAVLHNRPQKIDESAERAVVSALASGRTVALAYADCGTYGALDELCARYGVRRLPGLHCYDVFGGADRIAAMFDAEPGTYVLTDFLLRSFDRSVLAELGLDRYPDCGTTTSGTTPGWSGWRRNPRGAGSRGGPGGGNVRPAADPGRRRGVPAGAGAPGDPMTSLRELLSAPRYEVIPAKGTEQAVAEWVPAGMTVAVTASPVKGLEPTIELAGKLAARGYRVVPHLAARSVASEAHLDEIVARLKSCGVDDVFVPGGDATAPGRAVRRRAAAARAAGRDGPPVRPDRHHRLPGEPPQDPRRHHHPGHVGQAQVRQLHREQRDLRCRRSWPLDRRIRARGVTLPL